MLWAIDVGNTHTVIGLNDGSWNAVWRLATDADQTEDQIAAALSQLCSQKGVPFEASGAVIGSVVPATNATWRHFCSKWLDTEPSFLESGAQVGLTVAYDPPTAVGADRIANALAAIHRFGSPVVVVDFGTATTFDTVDSEGRYVGGAILPGVLVSMEALARRAAKLPQVALEVPERAIGSNTVDSLRSGIMIGYAGAVDAIAKRIRNELGGTARVVATGGLASAFQGMCEEISEVAPLLTLDGLLLARQRLTSRP